MQRTIHGGQLHFAYLHPQLKYRTVVIPTGSGQWTVSESTLETRIRLEPQEAVVLGFHAEPSSDSADAAFGDAPRREQYLQRWRNGLTRVAVPPNRLAEQVLNANVRDFASFPRIRCAKPSEERTDRRDLWDTRRRMPFTACGFAIHSNPSSPMCQSVHGQRRWHWMRPRKAIRLSPITIEFSFSDSAATPCSA